MFVYRTIKISQETGRIEDQEWSSVICYAFKGKKDGPRTDSKKPPAIHEENGRSHEYLQEICPKDC